MSATLACLNISRYRLYKPFHNIGMPKLTTGYATVLNFDKHFFGEVLSKYKLKIHEIASDLEVSTIFNTRHKYGNKKFVFILSFLSKVEPNEAWVYRLTSDEGGLTRAFSNRNRGRK